MSAGFKKIIVLGIPILLTVYVCDIGIQNIVRYNRFKFELKENEQKLKHAFTKHQFFANQIAQMETPEYWELSAKKRLGFIKKGEVVYKFFTPKDDM